MKINKKLRTNYCPNKQVEDNNSVGPANCNIASRERSVDISTPFPGINYKFPTSMTTLEKISPGRSGNVRRANVFRNFSAPRHGGKRGRLAKIFGKHILTWATFGTDMRPLVWF
jgi:hypothetical protein